MRTFEERAAVFQKEYRNLEQRTGYYFDISVTSERLKGEDGSIEVRDRIKLVALPIPGWIEPVTDTSHLPNVSNPPESPAHKPEP